ncbi:MAG: hypothetical protein M3Q07_16895 [Pseudobdellovibrionaceae bacterium]|nr:hypothetical protein [Pseudobdellovibrionaceae bacterium]
MIEAIFRKIYPAFDSQSIENIRLQADPEIREAILWEYSLEPLLPYAVDPKRLDEEVQEFMRLHGTLFAIRTAMRWVGFGSIRFFPLSSFEYEVDPGRIPTDREISAIIAALSVSVQARGKLKRIFHGTFEVKYE